MFRFGIPVTDLIEPIIPATQALVDSAGEGGKPYSRAKYITGPGQFYSRAWEPSIPRQGPRVRTLVSGGMTSAFS